MRTATTILTCAVFIASAQTAKGPPPIFGSVEAFSDTVVYIRSGLQLLPLSVNDHTEVWKGKVFHDLSMLEVGDRIIAVYRRDASGKLVADAITLNAVNVFGVVTRSDRSNEIEVFTNPNADPQSAYKQETKIVALDSDTTFEGSVKEDLLPGRKVQIVGVDLKRTIRATKVTVFGVATLTMPVTLPNGKRR